MFGIGPTELAFFLVIVLLAVGPDRLPAFMRTVGKGLRQVRNASREFKDAIGLDELMREGDPFRAPPVRPPRSRPVPLRDEETPAPARPTPPPPPPQAIAQSVAPAPSAEAEANGEAEPAAEADVPSESKHP